MILALVGSRTLVDYSLVVTEIERLEVALATKITGLVSGGAKGIDALAQQFALENSLPIQIILPDYATFGRRAPLIRNAEIVKSSQVVLALWDGESRGTAHTIKLAQKLGIQTIVVVVQPGP